MTGRKTRRQNLTLLWLPRLSIDLYSSFTSRGRNNVFWHAGRKFFLVGKKITKEFLADLTVPEQWPVLDTKGGPAGRESQGHAARSA